MTPAPAPAPVDCLFCGKAAEHRHHLTGRHPDGHYLDPDLVVELCHNHHRLVHDDLRSQHLDIPPAGPQWDPYAFRLGRLGVFFGRYATYADPPAWARLASGLRSWANPAHHERTPT